MKNIMGRISNQDRDPDPDEVDFSGVDNSFLPWIHNDPKAMYYNVGFSRGIMNSLRLNWYHGMVTKIQKSRYS